MERYVVSVNGGALRAGDVSGNRKTVGSAIPDSFATIRKLSREGSHRNRGFFLDAVKRCDERGIGTKRARSPVVGSLTR